jgi:polysaccharide export outer membrane protein
LKLPVARWGRPSAFIPFLVLLPWGVAPVRCADEPVARAEAAAESSWPPAREEPATDYLLQPLDLLAFEVFQEADLKLEVRISKEGTITLPLIGLVEVKGLSVRAAAELIRQRYQAKYLRNPQVTLLVKEYTQRTVSVIGSVTNPGTVKFQPEQPLSLIEALSSVGGFNRLADKRKVKLTRLNPDGTSVTHVIDVEALLSGSKTAEWPLQPRDVIFVPERIL